MKTIDKITMIHLLVRDMDRAKSFYTDKLGFEATKDNKYGGNRWVVVVPPGVVPLLFLVLSMKNSSLGLL